MSFNLFCYDTLEKLETLPDNSVDSIVSDPPYGLKFMGKKWDYQVPGVEIWQECLRVIKPGGYILIACGTRTQHRMAVNIEDGGFEIRDVITWHYGNGFPKSLDISKAIDKQARAIREITGSQRTNTGMQGNNYSNGSRNEIINKHDLPATAAAAKYDGWGTALKPATEFWTLARKPLSENTVADNILKHGTGGINIDGCRIDVYDNDPNHRHNWENHTAQRKGKIYGEYNERNRETLTQGRFPANVIFDEFTGTLLDEQTGTLTSGKKVGTGETKNNYGIYGVFKDSNKTFDASEGGASRFFYCAKASQSERDRGLEGFENSERKTYGDLQGTPEHSEKINIVAKNNHPTVKPLKLMQYLVRLITPVGGTCLDMYAGSGTTLCACIIEGFDCIGIDREPDYIKITEARCRYYVNERFKKYY